MYLVHKISRQRRCRGLEPEDLFQEGCCGLLLAVDRFDPNRGCSFQNFAKMLIWQSISRAIAEKATIVAVPETMAKPVRRFRRIRRIGLLKRGIVPVPEEIALKMNLPPGSYEFIRRAWAARRPTSRVPAGALVSAARDGRDPVDAAHQIELSQTIEQVLKKVAKREARIIRWRFGIGCDQPKTLEEIGRRLKLTREGVRQIEVRVLTRLRHPAVGRALQAFIDNPS